MRQWSGMRIYIKAPHRDDPSWLFRWMIGSTLEPILARGFKLMLSEDFEKTLLFAKCFSGVCVSLIPALKRKKNRLACDCLCHFVKFGVILGDLKSCWREKSNCDGDIPFFCRRFSERWTWSHRLKFAQLLPSLLLLSSLVHLSLPPHPEY